jgi:hypothetical protein
MDVWLIYASASILFSYQLDIDFSDDKAHRFDRRLGIAAAILLGTIEGKQSS